MPIYQSALERILPTGIDVFVALLVSPPNLEGFHEVEPVDPWYARAHQSGWSVGSDSSGLYVANTSSIAFSAVTGSATTITAWGLYLVAVGGALLAGGLIRNIAGVAQPQYLTVGDQARFLTDALKIRSGS